MTTLATEVHNRTMARLSEAVYWVRMGKDVSNHCSHFVTCQRAKAAATHPAPFQPVVASRPLELVAVDILKVQCHARETSICL